MTDNHTILVAVNVSAENRTDAQHQVMAWLGSPPPGGEWWIAEDDRIDGSDCDSAVFVQPGHQDEASRWLLATGFTPAHNVTDRNRGRFASESQEASS